MRKSMKKEKVPEGGREKEREEGGLFISCGFKGGVTAFSFFFLFNFLHVISLGSLRSSGGEGERE